jgi:hypothetical protein
MLTWAKPEENDVAQKERDKFWRVLYVDDFPAADGIDPLTRIVYLDESTWHSRRTAEVQKLELDRLPPPYEAHWIERLIDLDEIYLCLRQRWHECLSKVDVGHTSDFLEKVNEWQWDPLELLKNPIYVRMRRPRTKYCQMELNGRIYDSWDSRPSYFTLERLREATRVGYLIFPNWGYREYQRTKNNLSGQETRLIYNMK